GDGGEDFGAGQCVRSEDFVEGGRLRNGCDRQSACRRPGGSRPLPDHVDPDGGKRLTGSGRHGIRTCSKEGLFEVLGRESFLVGKEVFPSVPVKSFIRTFQKGEKGIGHQSRDYRDGFFRQVSFGGAETAESGGSGGDRLKPSGTGGTGGEGIRHSQGVRGCPSADPRSGGGSGSQLHPQSPSFSAQP